MTLIKLLEKAETFGKEGNREIQTRKRTWKETGNLGELFIKQIQS